MEARALAAWAVALVFTDANAGGPSQDPAPAAWYVPAVEEVLRAKRVPGAVVGVVRGGRLDSTSALGWRDVERGLPMTVDTLFQVGSLSKPLTATVLGRLARRGVVDPTDTVGEHLPAEAGIPDPIRGLTLEQLATHTSGLPREPVNRRDVPGSPGVMEPYSVEELYAGLRDTHLEAPPGARWAYSNLGYLLLGHVLERAAGRDYRTLLRQEVLDALSMDDSGVTPTAEHERRLAVHYWPEDDVRTPRPRWVFGEVAAAAGAYSSVDDLARFVLAQWREDEPWSALAPLLQEPRVETGNRAGRWMSLAWLVDRAPGVGPILGHGGEVDGHSACLAVVPRLRLGLVVLCNQGGDAAESVVRTLMPQLLERAAAGAPPGDGAVLPGGREER